MSVERVTVTRLTPAGASEPIELLRADRTTHRFAPHMHPEYAIGVVEAGGVRTRLGATCIDAPPGSILALNPGEVHTGEPIDRAGCSYRMIHVTDRVLRELVGARTPDDMPERAIVFPRAAIHDAPLAAQLRRAHALLEARIEVHAGEEALAGALAELVARYGARPSPPPPAVPLHARIVDTVRAHIEANHTRVVTLGELARLTGFSPFHLTRIFRAAVGVPPYAYLSLVRVWRARDLLARGRPLSSVTYETGFFDQSHLTRQFKRVFGVPPGQYARDLLRPAAIAPRHAGPFADRPLIGLAPIVRSCGITGDDASAEARATAVRRAGGAR